MDKKGGYYKPWLSTDEAILLNEMDSKNKLLNLIYEEPGAAEPEEEENFDAELFGATNDGLSIDGGGSVRPPNAGGSVRPPNAERMRGGFVGALVGAAAPLIIKGIAELIKWGINKRKQKQATPESIRPIAGRGAAGSSFKRRLNKWMLKNAPIMAREEARILKGSGSGGALAAPAMNRLLNRYIKSALQSVNQLSHPAAKTLAYKFTNKILPAPLVNAIVKMAAKRGANPLAAHYAGLADWAAKLANQPLSPAAKLKALDAANRFASSKDGGASVIAEGGSIKSFFKTIKDKGAEFLRATLPDLITKGSNLANMGVAKLVDYVGTKYGFDEETNKFVKSLANKAITSAAEIGSDYARKKAEPATEKLGELTDKGESLATTAANLAERAASSAMDKIASKIESVPDAPGWLQDLISGPVKVKNLDEPEPKTFDAYRAPDKATITQLVRDTIGMGKRRTTAKSKKKAVMGGAIRINWQN